MKIRNHNQQEVTSGSNVDEMTTLTIEATPAKGYKLDSIYLNGKRSDELYFTIEEDTCIEAFFSKQQ